MSDSIDDALTLSKNRAAYVGAAVKFLGKDRQRDAEVLADLMVKHIEKICAAANVVIKPAGAIPSNVQPLLEQLGPQILAHAEQIARVAVVEMTQAFQETLVCAARALGNEPPTN